MNFNFTQSVKIIILAIMIGGGVYFANAAFRPINIGSDAQLKSGGLGVAGNSGENFVSFGKSYLLEDSYVGFPTILGQSFPANLSVYGNASATSKGQFGDVVGGNYIELGHNGTQSHIDAKNSESSGLYLNSNVGGDVSVGGGLGGASDVNVSGDLVSTPLSNGTLHPVCADNNGNLILCP
jgi:hypothetical protein